MTKITWIFGVAFGIVLYAAGGTGGPNATFTLACNKGVTATLDQVTAFNDAPAVATKSGPCGSPFSCSSNTTSMLCVGRDAATGTGFTVKGYTAGNTTGSAPWGLNVTDSKGSKQSCIASGMVPSKFSCTTVNGKGVTLNVVNSK